MLNGLYTVTRGMIATEKGKDMIANNLANSSTPGFKADQAIYQSFPEILISRLDENGQKAIGKKGTGSKLATSFTDFSSGSMQATENPLDVALQGAGFLVVQAPWGLAYTRGGHFTQDQLGRLVTSAGYPVLGQLGFIETGGRPVIIDEQGSILIDDNQIDSLRVVDFLEPQRLEKVGDNLFRAPAGLAEIAPDAIVRQGFIEGSNVNVILGMTQLITATRLYEISQKMIQSQDETLAKAVNQVGRATG